MPPSERDTQPSCRASEQQFLRNLEGRLSHALARLTATVYRLSGDWRDWRPVLTRASAHVAVLIVALLGVLLSNIEWSARTASTWSISRALSAARGDEQPTLAQPPLVTTTQIEYRPVASVGSAAHVGRQPNPHTILPKRPRLEIITYTVEAGDTIQSIADEFGLDPTTVMWANPAVEDAPDLLRIGQKIVILPIDGVYHEVEEGDTLTSIAEAYEVERNAIIECEHNDLKRPVRNLEPGIYLIVPGGEKPYEPKVVTAYSGPVPEGARGSGRFQWPVLGAITQDYWYGHRAIDLGAPTGSAVMATDGGFVSFAGWTDVGYGYLIVVDHANGFATYYAHLSNIYVAEGQGVERGQVIGAVGNTGNSTGPHLHFEVRHYNRQQNPRAYLP